MIASIGLELPAVRSAKVFSASGRQSWRVYQLSSGRGTAAVGDAVCGACIISS